MADMYGTPPSLLTASAAMPSDSDDFSAFFTHLLRNSPSSSILSKPKTSPPPPWVPPPVGTAVFGRLGSDSPHRNGKSDAVSDSFEFSDPYGYVPPDVKEAPGNGNELFPTGIDDSDENISFKEHRISPEIDPPGDFIFDVEKNGESSQTKRVPARTSSKRSRAAEVHNMSEKRRRSRINEKMKALQNLIPNSNKTDKASMLDEAIEYLKQLQFQVQMLMMRNGLSLHPMCLPGSMTLPQTEFNFDESNVYHNSSRGIASSSSLNNAECLVPPPDFSLPKHCNISDQPPMIIPSITNMSNNPDTSTGFRFHVTQFDPSTSSKDALSNGAPQLHLDAAKIEKSASSDVS